MPAVLRGTRGGRVGLRLRLDRAATGYDEVLVSIADAAGVAADIVARTSPVVTRCP